MSRNVIDVCLESEVSAASSLTESLCDRPQNACAYGIEGLGRTVGDGASHIFANISSVAQAIGSSYALRIQAVMKE